MSPLRSTLDERLLAEWCHLLAHRDSGSHWHMLQAKGTECFDIDARKVILCACLNIGLEVWPVDLKWSRAQSVAACRISSSLNREIFLMLWKWMCAWSQEQISASGEKFNYRRVLNNTHTDQVRYTNECWHSRWWKSPNEIQLSVAAIFSWHSW